MKRSDLYYGKAGNHFHLLFQSSGISVCTLEKIKVSISFFKVLKSPLILWKSLKFPSPFSKCSNLPLYFGKVYSFHLLFQSSGISVCTLEKIKVSISFFKVLESPLVLWKSLQFPSPFSKFSNLRLYFGKVYSFHLLFQSSRISPCNLEKFKSLEV